MPRSVAPMSHAQRLADYGTVSTALSLLSDRRLRDLVEDAAVVHSGIGGTAMALDVEGVPVFAKRIPLTDLERRPENVLSTANLFDLPVYYQYGMGSAGFGVWRELAAHVMTTNWVLGRQNEGFPLMYHWRVVGGRPTTAEDHEDVDRSVAYWNGSPAVRERIEAIRRSSASVVLFLEHIPHNLHEWLTAQAAQDTVESAFALAYRGLHAGVSFMRSQGMTHFDAYFLNVLTDGADVYFTDFGLATSSRFELSADEREFFEDHRDYDEHHAMTFLANWLAKAGTPLSAAAFVERYGPVADVMNDFYRAQREDITSAYPLATRSGHLGVD